VSTRETASRAIARLDGIAWQRCHDSHYSPRSTLAFEREDRVLEAAQGSGSDHGSLGNNRAAVHPFQGILPRLCTERPYTGCVVSMSMCRAALIVHGERRVRLGRLFNFRYSTGALAFAIP
jgi:hypothetical protein